MDVLRAATLVTQDLDAAVARYQHWFGYAVIERGTVTDVVARHWDAEKTAGRPYALMGPASGAPVYLRFIEEDATPGYQPLRTYGWAAIELCVQNVIATDAALNGGPFDVIGPPAVNPGLAKIHPMQVVGPDHEIVFLTETQVGGPSARHPVARSPVDKLFILVLACEHMSATADWFGAALGLHIGPVWTLPYSVLSEAFGLQKDHLHQLQTADVDGRVLLEFDAYPPAAAPRPRLRGQLPPGVAIATLTRPDLHKLDVEWILPPQPQPGPLYQGKRMGVIRSPEGALIEVIEAGR